MNIGDKVIAVSSVTYSSLVIGKEYTISGRHSNNRGDFIRVKEINGGDNSFFTHRFILVEEEN